MPRPIYIVGGEQLATGTDLPKPRGSWTAVQGSPDGVVTVGAMFPGEEHGRYAEIAPDSLLTNNPRLLFRQEVSHPSPPRSCSADGWIVDSIDAQRSKVTLVHDGRRSTVSVDDVVRHNLEALRTRIEVSRDP